ncbi:MAG: Holliday junction branch migration protein RuvA [Ruthenibacterium sp.]
MIYCLTGKLLEKTPNEVVISCAGVGYLVQIPSSAAGALPAVGETCTLYTYMNVTDSAVSLFGFADKESQMMFKILTSVSGVGPKAGLAILSVLPAERIVLAISAGDHKAFTAASGVGPKLGQRIVLELKDKVGKGLAGGVSFADVGAAAGAPMGGTVSQAIAALASLGYTSSEAALAVSKLDANLPVQELIRLALQGIGKGR